MMIEIDETREVTSLGHENQVITLAGFIEQLMRARGYRFPAQAWQEILEAGASRVGQLYRYNLKRKNADAKFRPYKPLKLSATERGNVERAARAEGIVAEQAQDWRCAQMERTDTEFTRRCLKPRGHNNDHSF